MKDMLAKAQEKAEQTIFNDLNITIKVKLRKSELGNYHEAILPEQPISTSTIGVIALMMETLVVGVRVYLFEERKLSVEYHFMYSHPSGGRNGCEAKRSFDLPLF